MSEQPARGEIAWGWVVRIGSFALFTAGFIRGGGPGFGVMLLAMAAAAFPAKDFRGFLRSWRSRDEGDSA